MIFGKKKKEEIDTGSELRDLIVDYKQTFGTPHGKRVLFDLMDRFHIMRSHGGEPLKEGQRSVVIEILTKCNISITQFDQMLKGDNE